MVKSVKPEWLRRPIPNAAALTKMKGLMEGLQLHTVCESAHCPNQGDCFARNTATFMILGDVCTRNCRFCAVKHGQPAPPDVNEPEHLVEAVTKLRLRYVVVTSVTRDDLPDGGAYQFAKVVEAIRDYDPEIPTEVLIPDFQGSSSALEAVIASHPAVINHNVETVPRLYPQVRPQADYERSIHLLKQTKSMAGGIITKSGLMVGLGEKYEEIVKVMEDLRAVGCDFLTIGQYLQPSKNLFEVVKFVHPAEFEEYKKAGLSIGFTDVASAPYVRSSFQADKMFRKKP
ncbi:MAG: lipoyl synthase [Deltaproteobacteria bacterium]|nr:lipoyl synthase [Deltaproteobacteria bacterium]